MRATTAITATTAEPGPGAANPALAIVTHESAADVDRHLPGQAALARDLGARLIVVDNASTDRTVELVRERGGEAVTLLTQARNLGYAAAVNAAFTAAPGRDVLLLNPDVAAPRADDVETMARFLASTPRAAVVAPRLVGEDGEAQPSARRFPSLLSMLGSVPALGGLSRARASYADYQSPSYATEAAVVDWVIGAAMLIRRSAYDEVGGWDERFFLYMEDADFCRRLARAGWEVWLLPAVRAEHDYARASTSGGSIARSKARRRHVVSLARFFAREPRMLVGGRQAMSGEPPVEVLIPHHNRAQSLARTLDALALQTVRPEVCVIDNASTDGTAELLAADHPDVRVVALEANLGFGAAINRGAGSSRARLLVLLNNDAVPDPGFIERIEATQRARGAEMIAACLRAPDGTVESLGVEVDGSLNAYDACHGLEYRPDLEARPLGPSGGAGAYLRAAFTASGGFDETIFAYLEDVDLALRMRLAGMGCAVAADAWAVHEHSATLGARSAAKNELLGFARGYLLWKHGRSLSPGARAWAQITDAIVYSGKALLDRNLGAPRGRLRARRAVRSRPRPEADPGFASLPLSRPGPVGSLARRLARRR